MFAGNFLAAAAHLGSALETTIGAAEEVAAEAVGTIAQAPQVVAKMNESLAKLKVDGSGSVDLFKTQLLRMDAEIACFAATHTSVDIKVNLLSDLKAALTGSEVARIAEKAITDKIEELNGIGAGNTESNKLAANLGLAKRLTEGLHGVSELKAALAKSDEKAAEMAKRAIMDKIEELKDIGDRKREANLELAKRLSKGLRGLSELKAALANHDENAAEKAKKAITDRIKALEDIGDHNGERGPNLELAKRLRGVSELQAALANHDENAAEMAEKAIAKIRELQERLSEDIGEGNGGSNKLAANLELAIKAGMAKSEAAKYAETAITERIKELEDISDRNGEPGGSLSSELATRLTEGLRGLRELKGALGTHDENAAEEAKKAITKLMELQDIGARNGEPNKLAADLELAIKAALAKFDENAAKYAETAIREKIEELEDIGERNSERGPNLELAKRLTDGLSGLSELKAAQANSGENVAEAKKAIAETINELKDIDDRNGEPNRLAANLEQAIKTALANPGEYVTEKTKTAITETINELKDIDDRSGEPNKLAANLEQAIKAALANPAEYVAEAQKAITEKIEELEDIGDREHGANLELATRLTEGLSELKAALANPDEKAAEMAEKAIADKIKELQDIGEGNGEPNKLAANLELAIKAALAKSDAAKYAKTAITDKIKRLKDMSDVGDGGEPNSKLAANLELAKTLEEGLRKVQLAQDREGVQTLLKNTALAKVKESQAFFEEQLLHMDTFSNLADTTMHGVDGAAHVCLLSKLEDALANSNKKAFDIAEKAIRENIVQLKGIAYGAGDHYKGAALELANKLTEGLYVIKRDRKNTQSNVYRSVLAKVIEAKTKDEMHEADRRVEAEIEALRKIIDDAKTDAAILQRTALEMLKLSKDFNKILVQRKYTKHDAAKAKTMHNIITHVDTDKGSWKLLYLTNPQATALAEVMEDEASGDSGVARLLNAFGIADPNSISGTKLVIRLQLSHGSLKWCASATPGSRVDPENCPETRGEYYPPPYVDGEQGALMAEEKLVDWFSTELIPLAVKQRALVMMSSRTSCFVGGCFSKAIAKVRGGFPGRTLPFATLAYGAARDITAYDMDLVSQRTSANRKGGSQFETGGEGGKEERHWNVLYRACKLWQRRRKVLCACEHRQGVDDVPWDVDNYIIFEACDDEKFNPDQEWAQDINDAPDDNGPMCRFISSLFSCLNDTTPCVSIKTGLGELCGGPETLSSLKATVDVMTGGCPLVFIDLRDRDSADDPTGSELQRSFVLPPRVFLHNSKGKGKPVDIVLSRLVDRPMVDTGTPSAVFRSFHDAIVASQQFTALEWPTTDGKGGELESSARRFFEEVDKLVMQAVGVEPAELSKGKQRKLLERVKKQFDLKAPSGLRDMVAKASEKAATVTEFRKMVVNKAVEADPSFAVAAVNGAELGPSPAAGVRVPNPAFKLPLPPNTQGIPQGPAAQPFEVPVATPEQPSIMALTPPGRSANNPPYTSLFGADFSYTEHLEALEPGLAVQHPYTTYGLGLQTAPEPHWGRFTVVSEVLPGSAACKAGIKNGDILLKVGKTVLATMDHERVAATLEKAVNDAVEKLEPEPSPAVQDVQEQDSDLIGIVGPDLPERSQGWGHRILAPFAGARRLIKKCSPSSQTVQLTVCTQAEYDRMPTVYGMLGIPEEHDGAGEEKVTPRVVEQMRRARQDQFTQYKIKRLEGFITSFDKDCDKLVPDSPLCDELVKRGGISEKLRSKAVAAFERSARAELSGSANCKRKKHDASTLQLVFMARHGLQPPSELLSAFPRPQGPTAQLLEATVATPGEPSIKARLAERRQLRGSQPTAEGIPNGVEFASIQDHLTQSASNSLSTRPSPTDTDDKADNATARKTLDGDSEIRDQPKVTENAVGKAEAAHRSAVESDLAIDVLSNLGLLLEHKDDSDEAHAAYLAAVAASEFDANETANRVVQSDKGGCATSDETSETKSGNNEVETPGQSDTSTDLTKQTGGKKTDADTLDTEKIARRMPEVFEFMVIAHIHTEISTTFDYSTHEGDAKAAEPLDRAVKRRKLLALTGGALSSDPKELTKAGMTELLVDFCFDRLFCDWFALTKEGAQAACALKGDKNYDRYLEFVQQHCGTEMLKMKANALQVLKSDKFYGIGLLKSGAAVGRVTSLRKIVGGTGRTPRQETLAAMTMLQQAWDIVDLSHSQASVYKFLTKLMFAMQLLLGIAAVMVTIVSAKSEHEEDFKAAILAITVAATLVTGLTAFFNPQARWKELRCIATSLQSTIYQFRTRTANFAGGTPTDDSSPVKQFYEEILTAQLALYQGADLAQDRVTATLRHREVGFWNMGNVFDWVIHWCTAPPLPTGHRVPVSHRKAVNGWPHLTPAGIKRRNVEIRTKERLEKHLKAGIRGGQGETHLQDPEADIEKLAAQAKPLDNWDDCHSPLKPSNYVTARLKPMVQFYEARQPRVYRKQTRIKVLLLLITAASTVLSVYLMFAAVAALTVIAAALVSWAEFNGLENKVARYNHTMFVLNDLILWWDSLNYVDQSTAANLDKLVGEGERAMNAELTTWRAAVTATATRMAAGSTEQEEPHPEQTSAQAAGEAQGLRQRKKKKAGV